ncbi:MAG TPA: ABC transporter substrate-binding protein [Acidimicrobiales bacterium]
MAALVIGCEPAAWGASSGASSAPGVTSNTITIGFVTSETGAAAPTFSDSAGGAMARFALQNAHGGIDGRKLKLVEKDDQSSTTVSADVGTELGDSGVFGVIEDSAIDEDYESGDKALASLQVPVTTWGTNVVDSNVFGSAGANLPVEGPLDGSYYLYDYLGPFLKSIGVSKLAGITYSSIGQGLDEDFKALKSDGISTCYEDLKAPIGSVDFTVDALAINHLHCNGVLGVAIDSTDVGIGESLKNAGLDAKQLYDTGYDQEVLSQPLSASALNGAYITSELNMTNPDAQTKVMLSALKKYDPSYDGGLPDLGTWEAYLSADLMITGLQLAGTDPTRASFISNLRKLASYDAGGLLPDSLNYTHFGTPAGLPKTQCEYFMQLRSGKFYSTNGAKPWCGKLVKLSSS